MNRSTMLVLLSRGANVDAPDRQGNTILHYVTSLGDNISYVLNRNPQTELENKKGETALDMAIEKGSLAVVRDLRQTDALIRVKGDEKQLKLHQLVWMGYVDELQRRLDQLDAKTRTAQLGKLMPHAVESGRLDMLNFLLDRGAPVDSRDDLEWTPLHRASEAGNVG